MRIFSPRSRNRSRRERLSHQDPPRFTPREKAALPFTELIAGNHARISQDLFDELRQHYSEAEILDLGWRIAIFVGYGRLVYALGVEDYTVKKTSKRVVCEERCFS